jgi:hypothetical protein
MYITIWATISWGPGQKENVAHDLFLSMMVLDGLESNGAFMS